MTFYSSIVKNMSTLLDETIHIMPKCTVHFHGHRNKMVPRMELSILADFCNGAKFCNYTY
jgi:hypothetical protein